MAVFIGGLFRKSPIFGMRGSSGADGLRNRLLLTAIYGFSDCVVFGGFADMRREVNFLRSFVLWETEPYRQTLNSSTDKLCLMGRSNDCVMNEIQFR